MKYDIDSLEFRLLHPDEIEVRVGNVINGKKFKGCTLLLYQDARCAMDILDETVGCNNWMRDHKEIKGNLFGGISIWDETKSQWVTKWDCGVESNTEKQKGESSDSFKRSAVNWGIARELYSSPTIMVECDIKPKENGRGYELADKYQFNDTKVTYIAYNESREIVELAIEDKNGVIIFEHPKGKKKARRQESQKSVAPMPQQTPPQDYTPADMITAEEAQILKEEIENISYDTATLLAYIGKKKKASIMSIDSMTKDQYVFALRAVEELKKRRDAQQ